MKSTVKAGTIAPRNVVTNCLAWSNKQAGFYANHHLGGLDFSNNTSYRNKRNFNMVNRKSIEEAVDVDGYEHHLRNNLSYKPTLADANCVNINMDLCILENNTFLPSVSVSDSDFESLDASQLLRPRKADGSLPEITFLKLRETSPLKAMGVGYKFDTSAGLDDLQASVEDEGQYYTLSGVPVDNPSQGIYVRGSKKVYVR